MLLETITLVILIALSSFFSGSEIALLSLSDIKVRKLVRQRRRGAKILLKLRQNPHRLLVTVLIGNNVANIAAAGIATIVFTNAFGSNGIGIATGVMTFLILIFGEITPKSFCLQNAEKISLLVAGTIFVISKILYPAVVLVENLSLGLLKMLGYRRSRPKVTEEEIKTALIMGAEHGAIEKGEERMMHNILEFGDTRVSEIMTPRNKIVAIRSDQKIADALMKILESRYSRIPVYKKNFDEMIGTIHAKDVLKHLKRRQFDAEIENLVSPLIFVREDKKLDDLMNDFREKGVHLAIVTSGKRVKGLVTLEDLLEEIVGEIYDESDMKKTKMRLFDEKSIIVEASTPLKDLSGVMGIEFGRSDLKTIEDFIVSELGRFPRKGDCIGMENFRIVIKDVDRKGIRRIKIIKRGGKMRKTAE